MNETTAAATPIWPPQPPGAPIWPPAPQPPAQPAYPYAMRTSGYAIASLVLGILWLGWLGSLLAIIFGHLSYKEIRQSQGQIGGKGMATAGLVLGYIGAATFALMMALFVFAASAPTGSYS